MKQTNKLENIIMFIIYIILLIMAITMIYPFVYALTISLSTKTEVLRNGFHIIPREISFLSYQMVFKNPDIVVTYINTIFRTVVGTAFTLLVTSTYSYAISKSYMPHKKFYIFLTIFTMLFSGGMVPSYILIKNLHLIDNRLVYIIPGAITAWNVIILKSFFVSSIPDSLPESAKMDGANEFTILFKIVLPISKPVLATVALWTAVSHWNAWFDALLYINTPSKQVLQLYLQRIIREGSVNLISQGMINPDQMEFTSETIKFATIMVSIIPILCIYPFLQKHFTKGIMIGAIKG